MSTHGGLNSETTLVFSCELSAKRVLLLAVVTSLFCQCKALEVANMAS